MIYTFRKELSKWKLILWPVLISLSASSLVMIRRSSQTATVARVNGRAITFKDYSSRVRGLQEQINQLRGYARSSGIPIETFLQMYGLGDPAQAALDSAVHEKLVDGVLSPLWVSLHEDVVSSELLKMLPADFIDATGRVNHKAYRQFLQHRQMHIAEFEDGEEVKIYQGLFDEFVRNAAYSSAPQRRVLMEDKMAKKSFSLVKVSFDKVRGRLEDSIKDEEKEAYYDNHKESYRVPEKRTFSYWVVSPSMAERKVEAPDEVIERFYNRNKTKLYRVPPRVKVRHILIKESDGASALAAEVHKKISESPQSFAELAEEHSADSDTARNGGLRDFFSRGTYDKDFEKAAFRLKKPEDLSPVTKTDAGYEIVQLVERISAAEKPLSEVREEVEKAVRGKRALEWLRSHLERIRKDADNNKDVIAEVTGAAESHKTLDEATHSQANSYSIEGLVVENGFALRGQGSYGFFMHEDNYVLVHMTSKAGSYVPDFKQVQRQVESDMRDKRAHDKVAQDAAAIRTALINGGGIDEVADKHGAVHLSSDPVQVTQTTAAPFRGVSGLLRKAFMLTSTNQVVRHEANKDVYLVQLKEVEQKSAQEAAEAVGDLNHIGSTIDTHADLVSRAFIASLRRSAKIELNEKMLTVRPHNQF